MSNGFGLAEIKEEGTSYNIKTGEVGKAAPYVRNSAKIAKGDLYWAIARIKDALSEEHGSSGVTNIHDVAYLSGVVRKIEEIRGKL